MPISVYDQVGTNGFPKSPYPPISGRQQLTTTTVSAFSTRYKSDIEPGCAMARTDIFDDIKVFHNRSRRHSHLGGISPAARSQFDLEDREQSTPTRPTV